MKYNSLSIVAGLVFSLFIFLTPVNAFAQDSNPKEQLTNSQVESINPIKIEDCVNKYLEIKLVNGKKVNGKLVEYKNDNLTIKDGLIKKQISMANVVSFQIVKSPGEKFKEGLEETGAILQIVGTTALAIPALPVILPIDLIMHANGDCLENHWD